MLKGIGDYDILRKELKANKKIYFGEGNSDIEIEGVLSLCVLEDYRKVLSPNLEQKVNSYEFNPFYYLALRVYSDAFLYKADDFKRLLLPPLAVLHPYHSDRIRTQRGVFTVFPNYVLKGSAKAMMEHRGIDMREMERQTYIEECLQVIHILNPNEVAKELVCSGEKRSELYSDIQTYADIIETQQFYY